MNGPRLQRAGRGRLCPVLPIQPGLDDGGPGHRRRKARKEHEKRRSRWDDRREPFSLGRYLVVTVSEGCEPKNLLYLLDMDQVPRAASGELHVGQDLVYLPAYLPRVVVPAGALDFGPYDTYKGTGSNELPWAKVVSSFIGSWEYIANEGSVFWLQTNYRAPRDRLVKFDLATGAVDPDTFLEAGLLMPMHTATC